MFGTFRFILANMVVLTHIGGIEIISGIAVWSFFMLSGYLMTTVLNEKYGVDYKGLRVFATSRIIRLYPMYWCSILVSIGLILIFNGDVSARQINDQLIMPREFGNILSSAVIFGTTLFGLGRPQSALSPSVWAVDVELIMYIVSCIYLSRGYKKALNVFTVLILLFPFLWVVGKYLISSGNAELGNQLTYSFILVALIPYAGGALLYYKKETLVFLVNKVNPVISMVMVLLVVLLSVFFVSRYSVTVAYLLPMPAIAFVIVVLSQFSNAPSYAGRIDNFLGLMSYPIYLLHWTAAYAVVLMFDYFDSQQLISVLNDNGMIRFNITGYCYVTLFVIFLSFLSVHLIERPIDTFRTLYKNKKLGCVSEKGSF